MCNFALGDGVCLCTAAALPDSENAQVLKVVPTPDFARVAQVLYAVTDAPQGGEAARCSDAATLPRPEGAPANLYLADAVRDEAGLLHMAYLAKEHETAFDPVAMLIAVDNGGWQMQQIAEAARGEQPSPLNMPGFWDATARQVVLDAEYAYIENTADFTLFERSTATPRSERLRWTERD